MNALGRWNDICHVVRSMTYEQACAVVGVEHMQYAAPEIYLAATLRKAAGADASMRVTGVRFIGEPVA